ncbi:hypothetical protein ACIBP6_33650 [Nonomuraea terrae]|uniref:hypothetical protein n=1 Tax=Nonomuraea terrae TaxID=2530383 RepID=UPI0037ACD4A4
MVVGRTWTDAALDTGVELVSQGHLQAGIALLSETHDDPELRSLRTEALGDAAIGRSREIMELLDEADHPADVLLWLGRTIINEAWAIRGGGYASTVGSDRFKMFFATLSTAHEPLMEAARLRPDDAVPWESMIWYGLGMQLDRSEEDAIWAEITSRCDTLFSAHWARLQAVSAKWGGSHEDMFAHARSAVALAPPGDPLTAMLALAHLEYLLAEETRLVQESTLMAYMKFSMAYFSETVLSELKEAESRWTTGKRSHVRDVDAHHLFGAIFFQTRDTYDLAARHLSQVGNRVGEAAPWGYRGDPAEEFGKALQKLKLPLPR